MILGCATRQGRGAGRKKGCEAPRGEDTAQRYRRPEAHNSPKGWSGPQKGCEAPRTSTPHSGSAVRSPQLPEGVERAAKKGAKHRGRACRIAAAQSEAHNSPKGWSGPLKIRPGRFFVPVRPPLTIPCLRREFNRRKRPVRARGNRLSRNPTNELRKSKQSCIISLTCCA